MSHTNKAARITSDTPAVLNVFYTGGLIHPIRPPRSSRETSPGHLPSQPSIDMSADIATPTAFETHILGLLSSISAQPAAYPFPESFRLFDGPKTSVQETIERGVLAIGDRLRLAENTSTASLPTPDWTPPETSEACPTCHRSLKPTLGKIPSGPIPSALSSAASGGWAGDMGMSAEKELELLKAQVQDIARVCKVSFIPGIS